LYRRSTPVFPPRPESTRLSGIPCPGGRMNVSRLALAAVAATIFDALYGFLVYGTLLAPEFAKYPGVFRSNEAGQAFLPLMFGGLFIAILAAAVIYAKGYEGGSGVAEGVRF